VYRARRLKRSARHRFRPPGTPSEAEAAAESLCRAILVGKRPTRAEEPGKGRVLRDGKCSELEAAAGHEVRLASGSACSPHHGAPNHLGGECARPERRWKFEVAGRPESQKGEVLDSRALEAEIKEVNFSHATHLRGGGLRQRRARHRTPVHILSHRRAFVLEVEKAANVSRSCTEVGTYGGTLSLYPSRVKRDSPSLQARPLCGMDDSPPSSPSPQDGAKKHRPDRLRQHDERGFFCSRSHRIAAKRHRFEHIFLIASHYALFSLSGLNRQTACKACTISPRQQSRPERSIPTSWVATACHHGELCMRSSRLFFFRIIWHRPCPTT